MQNMLERSVFIPPLNLTPKVDTKLPLGKIFSQKNGDQKSKNIVETLKQNSQFIREKSLYRYYISKNRSPDSKEKRPPNPSDFQSLLKGEGARPKLARILSANDINGNGNLLQNPQKQLQLNKERYFKRKNRMNRTQLCGAKLKLQQNTMDNEEDHCEQSIIDMLNEPNLPMLKSSSTLSFQGMAGKQAEMMQLREQNQLISRQNSQLRRKLLEKEERIQELSASLQLLQEKNNDLQRQIEASKSKMACSQAEQARLISQLEAKEKTMRQLQSGYKYMQIENTVLSHTKAQCSAQVGVIGHLEKEKKMLEEKVRLLYELSKKKKVSKLAVKEDSEVSLSFSAEKEEREEGKFDILTADQKVRKKHKNQHSERIFVCSSNK